MDQTPNISMIQKPMTARILVSIVSLLLASSSFAGSRGFIVVMINIGDPTFFESNTYKAFKSNEPARLLEAQDCWHRSVTGGESLMHTTRIKLPAGMTKELAAAIWRGDPKALSVAQKILREGDEYSGGGGYDGLYILQPHKDVLTLMTIGSRSKTPSKKLSITLDMNDPSKAAAQFDLALCKVSKPLGVGFVP